LLAKAHAGALEADYAKEYLRQLEALGLTAIKKAVAGIEAEAAKSGREAVLCCFESLKEPGQYCHRTLFAKWYQERTGMEIQELGQEPDSSGLKFK
jgi:hypothetical protein